MSEAIVYPLLFSPVKIGPKTLRNRIFFTSHGMAMPVGGVIGERYHNYLVERAKGGVAAVVTMSAPVHPSSAGSPTTMNLWREEMLPEYARLSEDLHRYDTIGLVMLWHQGHIGSSRYNRYPLSAPSAIAAPGGDELPKALDQAEIEDIIEYYARCARIAWQGGMDGVQVQTSADYLLGSFLSPFLNRRQDQYGGSLENRMRVVVQILEAIRREVGPDFIVGLRTTASHQMPDGQGWQLTETKEFVRRLCAAHLIDFVDVIVGSYYNVGALMPLYNLKRGLAQDEAAEVRESSSVPVGTTGRIVDPDFAQRILAEGKADLIGLARPLIADPEWANKARHGRAEDIRLCMSCNQGCRAPVYIGRAGGCVVNPAASYESTLGLGTVKPAATVKKVLVVGGGPGGLEAARQAAERGHQVTLWEKNRQLGGAWRYVSETERFAEFGNMTKYLIRQVEKLAVQIELGREATAEAILAGNFEAVILATGAQPDRRGSSTGLESKIKGLDQPHVMVSREIFTRPDRPKNKEAKTILFDAVGSYESVGIAVALVEQAATLEILTPATTFAPASLGASGDTGSIYAWLFRHGAEITPMSDLTEIGPDYVTYRHVFTGAANRIENVEEVVVIFGNLPEDRLYSDLEGKVKELHRIGDCLAPRSAQIAIVDGNRVGREL